MKKRIQGHMLWIVSTLLCIQSTQAMDASQKKELRILYKLGKEHLLHGKNQKAVEYLSQAGELNYPPALDLLGWCFQNGCPEENHKLAAQFYEKSAKLRYIPSILNLAYCYTHGIGVEKDYKKARNLYQSIQEVSFEAKLKLGNLYIEGLVNKENTFTNNRDLSKKESLEFGFYLFEDLAERNYPKAFLAIARCHELGKGVPKNPIEASFWYKKYLEKNKNNNNSQQSESKQETESEKCSICYSPLVDEIKTLSSCVRGHIFHAPCLYTWGEKNPSCPLCRKSLVS